MSSVVISLGWLGFAAGLVYYIVQDRSGTPDFRYIDITQRILIVSVALILCGYLLKYLSRKLRLSQGKCRVCGKRVSKQEMYCFDHRLETIRKAQEHARIIEGKKR